MDASESLMAKESRISVLASGVSALDAQRTMRAVGDLVGHHEIIDGIRVRLTKVDCADGPFVVQVNLRVCERPARVQTPVAGIDDLAPALARLNHHIVRISGPWRPRSWPDLIRPTLTVGSEAQIIRRKSVVLERITPLEAVAVMDTMDYDVHLFSDAETGEDAVVYRAAPSGLRLAHQYRTAPPGQSWPSRSASTPPPLIANSRPTPALSDIAAVTLLRMHGRQFLFFTDPGTGRGKLVYPRYDTSLGLITPISNAVREVPS